jgi:hypothetical protein
MRVDAVTISPYINHLVQSTRNKSETLCGLLTSERRTLHILAPVCSVCTMVQEEDLFLRQSFQPGWTAQMKDVQSR